MNTLNNMGSMMTLAIVALAPATLVSCGSAENGSPFDGGATEASSTTSSDDGTGSATAATAGSGDTSGSSGSPPTDSASGGSASTSGGTKFDLGMVPDAPPEVDEPGCEKLDFLFVIDNSVSMENNQANLVANFPAFIRGIQATLTSVDEYQVGVVSTDKLINSNPDHCKEVGSLVVDTWGNYSSNMVCGPYAEGRNYMTEADDLATTFSCAAQLGTQGSIHELPMLAVEEAVSKQWNDPGECNEGFLRDDALLVIVIITDEADGPNDGEPQHPRVPPPVTSPGTPGTWFNTVVSSKFGIEQNVVVLSLIGWEGGPCGIDAAFGNAIDIKTFTEMFTYGFVGDICLPDYGPIFREAISIISTACGGFTPPG